MTQALNYSSKAIEALESHAKSAPPASAMGLRFLSKKLRQAQVFVLPVGGELMDRAKPRPELPGEAYTPPFQTVALEYPISGGPEPGILKTDQCPRRIALAWEWDGIMPNGGRVDPEMCFGRGTMIASISYYESIATWFPVALAMHLPRDLEWVEPIETPLDAALLECGRLTADVARARVPQFGYSLNLLPETFAELKARHGEEGAGLRLGYDLQDEVAAYLDLCCALACSNIRPELQEQPHRLNRARVKAGKMPLKDFHVLTVAGRGGAENFAGPNGEGVRSHLRRGHIRRLGPERITWVNACMVRGSRPGFVDKHYAPKEIAL